MNDSTFIGTKLPADEFRNFSIKAAERGLSKSALMRTLALDFLKGTRKPAARGARKARAA